MKIKVIVTLACIATLFAACKKENWADDWAGTYNNTTGITGINRVMIYTVDKKALKVELQSGFGSTFYTFATLSNVKLSSATTATVDEVGALSGESDPFHFTGSAVRNGNSISVSGQAINTNDPNDIRHYTFDGSK